MYPALAVVNSFQAAGQPPSLLWVGAVGGMEADLVQRANLPFTAIHGSAVVGVGPLKAALGLARLAVGTLQAWQLISRFRPQVIFATGGYTAIAVTLVGWLRRIPIAVYLPDIEPGRAIRLISRFARLILVTAEASRQYFPGKPVEVTGYPVRPELLTATRADAQRHFNLDPARRTVLLTGGSRGARSLNTALINTLPDLLTDLQVIHISGTLDWPTVAAARAALPADLQRHYHAFPYLHDDMGLAYAAADLVIARSGASSLGELPIFGAAAILVPYPYAWRYQKVNADVLATQGAAVRLDDPNLTTDLLPTLRSILNDPARLAAMSHAARAQARPDAALAIGRALQRLANGSSPTPAGPQP